MELTDYPTKVIHGLDRPPSYCPLDQMLKDGQERSKEIYEKRIGGDIFITLSPLRDTDGLIVGAVHVARDITDRKRAEKALQESENKFRTLAEKSLIGIYLVQDGLFRYINPKLAEIFGYPIDELRDKKGPVNLVFPEDWPIVKENLRKRLSGETASIHYEFRGVKKDGDVIHVEVFGSKTDYEGLPAVIGTLLDITDRKRAEKELQKSEKKLREVTSSLDEGLYVLDEQGHMTYMNPAAEKLLGWTEDELLNKKIHEIIHCRKPDGTTLPLNDCPMNTVIKTGSIYTADEEVFIRKDGTIFPISVRSSPIVEEGAVVACVTAFQDITQRKQTEAERKRLVTQLQEALEKVKTLRGFIPICASCKKVRDDKGYWTQVEAYVREHSLAEFSHGICPDCAKRLYPEYYQEDGKEKSKS